MHATQMYLENVRSHLKRLDRPAAKLLQDGLQREVIQQMTRSLPITLPTEVFDLYSWRDGTRIPQDCAVNDLDFFPGFYLLSLEEALSSYNAFKDDPRWNKYWFPLFANGGGDFYPVVGADERCQTGKIIGFMLNLPDHEQVAEYESLERMLQTLSTCYDEGVFYVNADGYLDADYQRQSLIAQTFNPSIELYRG